MNSGHTAMENVTLPSNDTSPDATGIPLEKIIICVIFYVVVLITILGNVLVLLAIKVEKRLQTLFNYYVVNLAVTDIGVAVSAMSFYTIDVTLGYWPFGEFMCAVWIFCDYGMTFASVFTLIAISLDRFWSVTWSLHYRTHHTRQKCFYIIVVIWVTMVILWLPACIIDRTNNQIDGVCVWEPSLNREYVIVIACVGHHGAFAILTFCYVRVLVFMYNRKVNPVNGRNRLANANSENATYIEPSAASTGVSTIPVPTKMATLTIPGSQTTSSAAQAVKARQSLKAWQQEETGSDGKPTKGKSTSGGGSKERKVFITLTYIIVGYVICWLPFHVVFDVSSIAPEQVPDAVFKVTFYMTYLNSTINPFLYNIGSAEFRQAFIKVLRCRWRSKT